MGKRIPPDLKAAIAREIERDVPHTMDLIRLVTLTDDEARDWLESFGYRIARIAWEARGRAEPPRENDAMTRMNDYYVRVNDGNEDVFYEHRVDEKGRHIATDLWIEQPIADGWRAAFRIVQNRVDTLPVIGEVRILPDEREFPTNWPGRWSADTLGFTARAPEGGVTASIIAAVRMTMPRVLLSKLVSKLSAQPSGDKSGISQWLTTFPHKHSDEPATVAQRDDEHR